MALPIGSRWLIRLNRTLRLHRGRMESDGWSNGSASQLSPAFQRWISSNFFQRFAVTGANFS
jgi:hypothetical protein